VPSGERDLFDDFGIAISPTTATTSVAYTDDQPAGTIRQDFSAYSTSN